MQDTWADYFSGETYGPADDEHERRSEERDAWLNDEADRLEYEAEAASWEDEDEGVECDACGGPVDAADGATDDCIVLCGSLYGRGCADAEGAFNY